MSDGVQLPDGFVMDAPGAAGLSGGERAVLALPAGFDLDPAPDAPASGLRPFRPGEFIDNGDGSRSTEILVTVPIDGKWYNVPSLWMGQSGPVRFDPDNEDAISAAAKSFMVTGGGKFPAYATVDEAVAAAENRSAGGGVFQGEITQAKGGVSLPPGFQLDDQPPAEHGALARGFVSGLIESNPRALASTLEGLGILTGADGMRSAADDLRAATAEGAAEYRPRGKGFTDIGGVEDFLTWAGESLGQGLASTVPSVIGGVAGGYAGKRIGGRVGGVAGATAGAATPSFALNYGELYDALKAEGVPEDKAADYALYGSGPMVALDVAGVEAIALRLAGAGRQQLARGIARRIVAEAGKGAAREGITEAAQEAVKQFTVAEATDQPFLTENTARAMLESGAAGALTGGALGGAAGVVRDKAAPAPQVEDVPASVLLGKPESEATDAAAETAAAPETPPAPQPGEPGYDPTGVDPFADLLPPETAPTMPQVDSLFEFLARKGGVRPDGELAAMDLRQRPVPGAGMLVRRDGMDLDRAREVATEAGYLADGADINALVEAMRREQRARAEGRVDGRVFPLADQADVTGDVSAARQAEEQRTAVDALRQFDREAGLGMSADEARRALDLMGQGYAADEAAMNAAYETAQAWADANIPETTDGTDPFALTDDIPFDAPAPGPAVPGGVAQPGAEGAGVAQPDVGAAVGGGAAPAEAGGADERELRLDARPSLPAVAYAGPTSFDTTPLSGPMYRDTDAYGLEDILVDGYLKKGGVSRIFVTDDPSLAIGQGDNTGVMVQLRGDALSGQEHRKPGTGVVGGREYVTNYLGADSIDRITVSKGVKLSKRAKALLTRYFDKQQDPDGKTVFVRRPSAVMLSASPTFTATAPQLERRIRRAWKRMGLDPARLFVEPSLTTDNAAAVRASGGVAAETSQAIAGKYEPFAKAAYVALDGADPASTAYHEGFHAVVDTLNLNTLEREALDAETERLRPLAAQELGLKADDPRVAGMVPEEVQAYAFEAWRRARDQGQRVTGVRYMVRRIFTRVADALRAMRGVLEGAGFLRAQDAVSAEDVYQRIGSGQVMARQRGRNAREAVEGIGYDMAGAVRKVPDVLRLSARRQDSELKKQAMVDRENGDTPADYYVHGRNGYSSSDGLDTGNVIMATQRWDIAEQYAGERGSIWAIRPMESSSVFDTTSEAQRKEVADSILRSIGGDTLPYDVESVFEGMSRDEIADSLYVGDIVDSGGVFEIPSFVTWLYETFGYDVALAHDGPRNDAAIFLNTDSADVATIEDGGVRLSARDRGVATEESAAEPVAERKRTLVRLVLDGQPIDAAFRAAFQLVPVLGRVNDKGESVVGRALYDRLDRTVTSAKFKDGTALGNLINPALEFARAGFLDRYGLSDSYKARDVQRQDEERALLMKGADFAQMLASRNVGPEEARVLHAMLTGEEVPAGDLADLAAPIRQAIDDIGAEAVRLGLVSPESYERNRGTYLHRVYMKHEAEVEATPLVRTLTRIKTRARRRGISGEGLKGRGLFMEVRRGRLIDGERAVAGDAAALVPEVVAGRQYRVLDKMSDPADREDLPGVEWEGVRARRVKERIYLPADKPVPKRFEGHEDRGIWEVRKAGAKVTLWRDFTKAEREQMGEILDARYTVAKTFHVLARDIATARFYKDIAENEEWSTDQEPDGLKISAGEASRLHTFAGVDWVEVPNTSIPNSGGKKKFGALAGRWVRAEVWRDIAELDRMYNRPGLWQALLTQWKLNKTVRSPVVHMNNIMSNLVFMDMADVRLVDLTRAVAEVARGGEAFQEAKAAGAFGADMLSQEVRRDVLEPVLKEIADQTMAPASRQQVGMLAALGALARRTYGLWETFDNGMQRAYQMEDDVFRLALYLRRRSMGDSAEAAALQAREQFLNYDIRAPWVNAARRSALPFISYTYRAVPVIARSIATRPWKLAKYFTLAAMVNALGYLGSDGDEDEERKALRDEEQGWTWVGVPRMIRMPWNDRTGNPVFLDVRRWIPAGDVFDTGHNRSPLPLPSWLQPGGPIMLGAELLLNRSAFTGKDIYNDVTDDGLDRAAKGAEYVYKAWMPSAAWIPGSWYWEKLGRAGVFPGREAGTRDDTKQAYLPEYAIASSFGIKLKQIDVDANMHWKARDIERSKNEIKAEMRQTMHDVRRKLISKAEADRQMRRLEEKLMQADERMRELGSR